MQNEMIANAIDYVDNLDYDAILKLQAAATRRADEIRANQKSAVVDDVLAKIQFFGLTLNDLQVLKGANHAAKGTTMAAKYYDPVTGTHWAGSGNPKEAFKEAHAFDVTNPNITPKRMDQYLIREYEAKEIALKIKKDVRTVSGGKKKVIKYNELIVEASNKPAEQVAA